MEKKGYPTFYMEYKGAVTPDYTLKLKMWKLFGPETLQVWRWNWETRSFFLHQTIPPGTMTVAPLFKPKPINPVDYGDELPEWLEMQK